MAEELTDEMYMGGVDPLLALDAEDEAVTEIRGMASTAPSAASAGGSAKSAGTPKPPKQPRASKSDASDKTAGGSGKKTPQQIGADTRKANKLAEDLIERADELVNFGLAIHALRSGKAPAHPEGFLDTFEAVDATSADAHDRIKNRRTTGMAVVTNTARLYGGGDRPWVLSAFELEGPAMRGEINSDFFLALDRRGARSVYDKLENGWVEDTAGGGRRWFFYVDAPTVDYAREIFKQVRCTSASRGGGVVAEFLFSKNSIIVAPSHGAVHPNGKHWSVVQGGPSTLPRLTVPELHLLSDTLEELTDVDVTQVESTASEARRNLTGEHRDALSAYDRRATTKETVARLEKAGWARTEEDQNGSVTLDKAGHAAVSVGGAVRPAGAVWTFSTSADPLPADQMSTAADVLALFDFDGDYAAAAQHLLDTGAVKLVPLPLASRTRPHVYPDSTDSVRLSSALSQALSQAQHPAFPGMPFVVAHTHPQSGKHLGLVSLRQEGALLRWSPADHGSLLLRVAQPAKLTKTSEVHEHAFNGSIVAMTIPEGEAPQGLQEVRYVATEPVLLPSGGVIANSGFHPTSDGNVLVAIPRREEGYWGAYKVPANPTPAHAQAAADYIYTELLNDFPFETTGDKARALGYLLTGVSRQLYGAAPGWASDAAERGTGKSLLASLQRIISTGTSTYAAIGFAASADAETTKQMVTAALSGKTQLHCDEVPRGSNVTSTVLSEYLTSDGAMEERLLGGNRSITIPPMVVTICGNNLELGGDANRRFIRVRQRITGAKLAFERTEFRHADVRAWALQHRPEILAALHTVLAYGLRTKRTRTLPSGYGSFEGWVDVVLGALSHLTLDGVPGDELFNDGRADFLDEQDDAGMDWGPFMEGWAEVFGTEMAVTAKDANKALANKKPSPLDLPMELLPQIGQAETGAVKSWGKALSRRDGTAVRYGGSLYRLNVRKNGKKGNQFVLTQESVSEDAIMPAPVEADAPTQTATPAVAQTAAPATPAPAPIVVPAMPTKVIDDSLEVLNFGF